MIKIMRLWWMTHKAAFRTVFPAKKGQRGQEKNTLVKPWKGALKIFLEHSLGRIRSHDQNHAFMVDDSQSCIKDSFPGEKRHKEAFEAPCFCFNVLPEVFRQYSEKVTF